MAKTLLPRYKAHSTPIFCVRSRTPGKRFAGSTILRFGYFVTGLYGEQASKYTSAFTIPADEGVLH